MVSALALIDTKRDAGSSHLIEAIFTELEAAEGCAMARNAFSAQLTGKTRTELEQQTIAALSSVNLILDAKAGADGRGFKAWLNEIAERVAGASNKIVLTVTPLQPRGNDCSTTLR
jgi:hypothetical protein